MKKFLKMGAILFFVALFIGTLIFLWNKTKPKTIVYHVETLSRDTLMNQTIATGRVEPRDEVLIKPQISGIISEIFVDAGEMIKQGEVIATVKVIPEMGNVNSAESRVNIARINLEQVTRENVRVEKLFAEGVITVEEREQSETSLKRAKEELQVAKDNKEIIEKGMTSRSSVSNTQVRATVTGMILDVPVKVGNSVILSNTFNDGTTIASIADLNEMLFVGNVDETEIGKLGEGMKAAITIGALQNISLDAELEYISPKATEENGIIVFEIKAATVIPDSIFVRAGYSANATIITEIRENVLSVQESVIKFEDKKPYVEVLTSPEEDAVQVFERRDVVLGLSNGVKVEILSGLDGTEKLKGGINREGKSTTVTKQMN